MPSIVSEEQRLVRLERFCSEKYHDLAYRVRDVSTGRLGALHGGRWHRHQKRYLSPWELRYHELSASGDEELDRARLKVVTEDVHSLQFDICEDITSPVIFGVGSRRGGKSRTIAKKVPIQCAEWPHIGGEVIGPTYPKLQIMWRYVLASLPKHWITRTREDEHFIELVTGQRIKFISSHNPDSVIGEGVGWIDFDEIQSVKEVAWALALPAVSDGGTAFQINAVGTPRPGEFRQRYERVKALTKQYDAKGNAKARIIKFTYRDNEFLETGDGTIFDLANGLIDPRKRKQELDAEFVSEEGLVYYRFDRAIHDKDWSTLQRGRRWAQDITAAWLQEAVECELVTPKFLIGIDYGVLRNYAVIYKIVKVNGLVCFWAVAEVYGDRDYDMSAFISELVARRFYPAVVIDDATGPKSKTGRRASRSLGSVQVRNGEVVATGGEHVFEIRHRTCKASGDRVDALNAMMGNTLDQVRWYVDTEACPRLTECIENQEMHLGKPARSKVGEVSYHDMPDAASYPPWYLFPASVPYEREERMRAAA